MAPGDLAALAPLLVLAGTAVVVMLAIAVRRHHEVTVALTAAGLVVVLFEIPHAARLAPRHVTSLVVVDPFALFFTGLIAAAALAVTLMAHGYLRGRAERPEEFYLLLLLASVGAATLVSSRHFAAIFLGLEILSVSLYGLIAYPRSARRPVEAGIKYLVLAAASASFLLFGVALIYAATGSLELSALVPAVAAARSGNGFGLAGLALFLVGAGFKLAVVPFHLWTPDVYEGAPAPAAAFVATASKGAVLALLVRLFAAAGGTHAPPVAITLALLAMASMLAGNLLALRQDNVKRLLAYSSIAHMGYALVAVLAAGALAAEALGFYLAAYFATTLAAFGVVSALSGKTVDADALAGYRGLFWRRPALAAVFAAALFSLGGVPLTAGFVGKYYVLAAGVRASAWVPVVVLAVSSVIGIYVYLRVVVALYAPVSADASRPLLLPSLSLASGAVLAALTLALLWLGVAPAPFIDLMRPLVGTVG